jgi:hypothetical protein
MPRVRILDRLALAAALLVTVAFLHGPNVAVIVALCLAVMEIDASLC